MKPQQHEFFAGTSVRVSLWLLPERPLRVQAQERKRFDCHIFWPVHPYH